MRFNMLQLISTMLHGCLCSAWSCSVPAAERVSFLLHAPYCLEENVRSQGDLWPVSGLLRWLSSLACLHLDEGANLLNGALRKYDKLSCLTGPDLIVHTYSSLLPIRSVGGDMVEEETRWMCAYFPLLVLLAALFTTLFSSNINVY